MSSLTLLVIAYVALAVFVLTVAVRTIRIARLPVHLRWELAPIPHEKGKNRYGGSYFEDFEWWTAPRERSLVDEMMYMFKEIVFLKAVWEHNRRMWWFSFPFHFGVYLLIVSAVFLLAAAGLQLAAVSSSLPSMLLAVALALAVIGYVLGIFGAAGLFVLRLVDARLRAFRNGLSLLNLGLLLAVFLTGAAALLALSDLPQRLSSFVQAVLTADGSMEVPGILAFHLIVVFVFLAYLPFTKMLHFVAKYFTYHRVRWDDEAMTQGSRLEQEVTKLLQQPVTWSASHLEADGKKNWVDIVTKEINE